MCIQRFSKSIQGITNLTEISKGGHFAQKKKKKVFLSWPCNGRSTVTTCVTVNHFVLIFHPSIVCILRKGRKVVSGEGRTTLFSRGQVNHFKQPRKNDPFSNFSDEGNSPEISLSGLWWWMSFFIHHIHVKTLTVSCPKCLFVFGSVEWDQVYHYYTKRDSGFPGRGRENKLCWRHHITGK